MKDAYYFTHDSNARHDEKMLQLRSVYRAQGYGWFWILVEMMRDATAYRLQYDGKYSFKAIAKELDCSEEQARQFVDDCINEFHLFALEDGAFFSPSLIRRMLPMEQKREKARQSARARWNQAGNANQMLTNSNGNTLDMRPHSDSNASKGNSKEDESKENDDDSVPALPATPSSPTVQLYNSANLCSIESLKTECLSDQAGFIDHVCRQQFFKQQRGSQDIISPALDSFNEHLRYKGEIIKGRSDYRSHFLNWFAKQDLNQYKPAGTAGITSNINNDATNLAQKYQ